jgi:hypothetical protein
MVPVLLGFMAGILLPQYREQFSMIEKLGVMRVARTFLRSDLVPPDSATFLFQLPYMHPVSMLALVVAMALPTLAFPAGARGRGTLDLLLATPLTRESLVATTFLFTLPFAALHAAAPFLGVWIGAAQAGVVSELPFGLFARVSIESFALALFFSGTTLLLSVGGLRSARARGPEAAGALGMLAALVLWSVLAEVVATMWSTFRWLKRLTPFGWFEPPQVLGGTRDPWLDGGVLAGFGLLCAALALFSERRRASV